MKKSNNIVNSAIGGLIALGLTAASMPAQAQEQEKCYGVVKAGKNDCQTKTSACAGTATKDSQTDAWIYVPKGTCAKIVGGDTAKK